MIDSVKIFVAFIIGSYLSYQFVIRVFSFAAIIDIIADWDQNMKVIDIVRLS